VLLPILHYRIDLAGFTAIELGGYLRVNALFANALAHFIRPTDILWVHDYHLLAFARPAATPTRSVSFYTFPFRRRTSCWPCRSTSRRLAH
jgi:trehalose-6-phosphate synthase